jgi:hypothetical protein
MGIIIIKNENCHFAGQTAIDTDLSCKWCGKTIKAGKEHFITWDYDSKYCSLSHLKQAFKAEKGL